MVRRVQPQRLAERPTYGFRDRPPTAPPTAVPTPAPTPVATLSFRGRGDDVVQLPAAYQTPVLLLTATYRGSDNFIVGPLSSTNQEGITVINDIGNYSGTVLFDSTQGAIASAIKIQATGPWTLKLSDLSTVQVFSSSVSGHGDDVLDYTGGPATDKVTNTGSTNFVVTEYPSGGSENLLVNAIGAYSGVQPLQAGPEIIAIMSDGNWSISPS